MHKFLRGGWVSPVMHLSRITRLAILRTGSLNDAVDGLACPVMPQTCITDQPLVRRRILCISPTTGPQPRRALRNRGAHAHHHANS